MGVEPPRMRGAPCYGDEAVCLCSLPGEDTVGSRLSANQERGPHQTLDLLETCSGLPASGAVRNKCLSHQTAIP